MNINDYSSYEHYTESIKFRKRFFLTDYGRAYNKKYWRLVLYLFIVYDQDLLTQLPLEQAQ